MIAQCEEYVACHKMYVNCHFAEMCSRLGFLKIYGRQEIPECKIREGYIIAACCNWVWTSLHIAHNLFRSWFSSLKTLEFFELYVHNEGSPALWLLGDILIFFNSYSSGGEDGYVRVHYFDPSYFDFRFEFWSRPELSDFW